MSTLSNRIAKMERVHADRGPVALGLVVLPVPGGGFSALGQDFPSAEQARAAFPERTGPCIVVNLEDCRRHAPKPEVDHAA